MNYADNPKWPDDWPTARFVGSLVDANVNPAGVRVTISPDRTVSSATDPLTVLPKSITVGMVDGAFDVEIPATDTTGSVPSVWRWDVRLGRVGYPMIEFSMSAPAGTTVLLKDKLADVLRSREWLWRKEVFDSIVTDGATKTMNDQGVITATGTGGGTTPGLVTLT